MMKIIKSCFNDLNCREVDYSDIELSLHFFLWCGKIQNGTNKSVEQQTESLSNESVHFRYSVVNKSCQIKIAVKNRRWYHKANSFTVVVYFNHCLTLQIYLFHFVLTFLASFFSPLHVNISSSCYIWWNTKSYVFIQYLFVCINWNLRERNNTSSGSLNNLTKNKTILSSSVFSYELHLLSGAE